MLLQGSGADVLVDIASPKFASQAIRKVSDVGWHPLHILNSPSWSVESVLKPAGLQKSVGLISATFRKDPSDPQWQSDPAIKEYRAFMKNYYPEGDPDDVYNVAGYLVAQALAHVLRQCGDDLTRENVMRQATHIKDLELPLLIPGIKVNTSPTDYRPIKQLQLTRFNGKRWELLGEVIGN